MPLTSDFALIDVDHARWVRAFKKQLLAIPGDTVKKNIYSRAGISVVELLGEFWGKVTAGYFFPLVAGSF